MSSSSRCRLWSTPRWRDSRRRQTPRWCTPACGRGSATQAGTDDAPRDLDILIRLGGPAKGRATRYFALRRALERASGLPVDLVEDEAVSNPYLRDDIERTGVTLIAAA